MQQVAKSNALLVVGTSLEVFSAYRFVNHAHQRGMPIAIVNFGETRAERLGLSSISYKSEANCAELLSAVAEKI
jgi:NAD-dependent SIR2 family protein deacetylase